MSTTYANDKSCNNFVAVISEVMTEELASEINEKNYISIMVGHKEVAHAHAQGDYIHLLFE